MEYARHGTLFQYLLKQERLCEEDIRKVIGQLILALDWMHRKGIFHRDIKPDNILVVDNQDLTVCITDLGMACRADDTYQTSLSCGTPGYIDPEILKGKPFTAKSDIFSVGGIFFNLVTLSPLFYGASGKEVILANKNQNPRLSVRLFVKQVSEECRSLLNMMLEPTHDQRASTEECLQHTWFKQDRETI